MGINLCHTAGSPPPTIWAGGAWLGGRTFVLTLGRSMGFSDLTRSSGALDPLPPASHEVFPILENGASILLDPWATDPTAPHGCGLSISRPCGLHPQTGPESEHFSHLHRHTLVWATGTSQRTAAVASSLVSTLLTLQGSAQASPPPGGLAAHLVIAGRSGRALKEHGHFRLDLLAVSYTGMEFP